MNSTQQIIETVQALPFAEQKKILDALERNLRARAETEIVDEAEIERILFERSVIGNLPEAGAYTDADDDFEPIEIAGKPLSETVIEDRS